MKEFITYDMLLIYTTFILVVFSIVEFIKELKPLKPIKTKYIAFMIACILVLIIYIYAFSGNYFTLNFIKYILLKIPLIIINGIMATFASNGISDFNNPVNKLEKES